MSLVASRRAPATLGLGAASPTRFAMPLLCFVLAFGVGVQGAFYGPQAVLVCSALVVLAITSVADAWPTMRSAAPAFVVLIAGLIASAAANGLPREALRPAMTLIVAGSALVSGVAIIRRGGRRRLLEMLTALGVLAAILGMTGLAFHVEPLALRAQGIWRTATTLTYANAAAMLFVLTLPAAMLLLRDRPRSSLRVVVFLMITALLTTLSRGAIAGLVVGGVVALLCGGRLLVAVSVRPAIASIVSAAGFIPTMASQPARPLPAIAGMVAGAAVCVIRLPRLSRHAGVAAVMAALAIALAAIVPAVRSAPMGQQLLRSRISRQSEDRLMFWKIAIRRGAEHPVFGTGPGTFTASYTWKGRPYVMRYAHNEYLQTFAESGVVGLSAVTGALVLLAAWAFRRRRVQRDRVVWAAAVAACSAFVVHAAFDFLWRIPVLIALTFLWLAIAVTSENPAKSSDKRLDRPDQTLAWARRAAR